jgi:molybdopterin-containing oxidoreductase family membrane subunit
MSADSTTATCDTAPPLRDSARARAASPHASASPHPHASPLPRPAILDEVNPAPLPRATLVAHGRSHNWITEKICGIIEGKTPAWWWVSFLAAAFVASWTVMGLIYLVSTGVGVWGHANPVNWAWDIVNFVFWIGIGHAGTLISAILCLLRQKWRTSINRAAEAMTIFAVVCAAIFPAFHVGRVWFAWFLFPVPNSNDIWQNFRSPLEWDVFAVSTYGIVSVLFWYVGLVPDLAVLRDRFFNAGKKIRSWLYGLFAMGWRGSNRHWSNYEMAYIILAGVSTPLVLSVHTIVSFDFAVSLLPGWHTTIFPPYFVAGAIFSGFGMVLTLMLPLRALFKLEDLITQYHIDCMCKITLATGTIVGYAYAMEFFIAWYSANPYEGFAFINRAFGPYAWAYWIMISCNVITPQLFWFKKIRCNTALVWTLSIFVNVGMWFERFVIIVTSLARDFLPSSWGYYSPSVVEIFTFFGTFGVFSVLFLLFIRFLPIMPMAELKAVTSQAGTHAKH